MLADILKNRLFIGALVFFVLCVAGSLLYMHHENIKGVQYAAETEDRVRQWNEQPTAKALVVETPQDGHLHADGNPWHEAAHTVQETNRPSAAMSEYSPEELQQIYDQFYIQHGLQPPPPGYEYRWADIGVPLLDENGNPILHKIGEPIVELEIRVGFAPTREEYERLDQLGIEEFRARQKGQITKANEILKEIETLKASAQRERPFVKRSTWLVPRAEYERDPNKGKRVAKQKLDAALRAYGLEHLIRP